MGRPAQARKWQEAAVALARKLEHPLTLFDTVTNELVFCVLLRDLGAVRQNAEAVLNFPASAGELKFQHNADIAKGARGCVLTDRGEVEAGFALIRESVAPMLNYGVSWTVAVLSLMATALARHGATQEGLELVSETLATLQRDIARW